MFWVRMQLRGQQKVQVVSKWLACLWLYFSDLSALGVFNNKYSVSVSC